MGNFKKHCIFVFFLIFGFSCYAGQISIQVVQHDKIQKNLSENSLVIEDELLTGFFENGYIVTNSPAMTSDSKGSDEKCFSIGMNDAFNGYSDYFVQIKLYYDGEKSDLSKVNWTLYSVSTGEKLEDSFINDFVMTKENKKDLHIVALQLISKIKEAINA
jgi:hypothetical protein